MFLFQQPKVITVSTKNITTPTVNLPRPMEEASDNTPTSFSALGSIQGLVSGLTTSTTAMKPGMIPGSKPKVWTVIIFAGLSTKSISY